MLNNRMMIPALIIPLVVALIVGLFFIFRADEQKDPTPPDTTDTQQPNQSGEDTDEIISIEVIPAFTGNAELSDERKAYINQGILSEIERTMAGVPVADENGSIVTDEAGSFIFEATTAFDFTNIENNLAIMINHFADKGYSFDSIQQIQRLYFHYSSNYSKYEIDELLDKLEACFPSNGTTPEALTEKAKEVFGHVREDGFPFVFEDTVVAEFSFYFCDVKPYFNEELTEEDEMICIFDIWHSEENAEYERNLELWCHKIVKELQKKNMDEETIIAAQILYAASLADTEYRATLIDDLVRCFADNALNDIILLNDRAYEIFGVNIEDNVPLMEYLNEVIA
jgi:hypothetical protein